MGILVKRPESLEAAERLDAVVLDKTGTITEGKPQVDGIFPASGYSEEQLLRLAAAVEREACARATFSRLAQGGRMGADGRSRRLLIRSADAEVLSVALGGHLIRRFASLSVVRPPESR